MTILTPLRCLLYVSLLVTLAGGEALARGPGGGRAGGRAAGGFSGPRVGGQSFSPGARPGVMANGPGSAAPRSAANVQQFLSGGAPAALNNPAGARQGHYAAQANAAWQNHQNGPQPFSPAWYAQHPQAWQYTHPHADAAAVASAAAVSAWLAYGAYPYPASTTSTTLVYETTAAPTAEAPPEQLDAASTPGAADPEWLGLGVFELKTTPTAPATQLVQLAVNRLGEVKGVQIDHLTGSTQNVAGTVDQATQQVRWSLESNAGATFTTQLDSLTQSQGSVTLTFPSGVQTWVLQRVDGP